MSATELVNWEITLDKPDYFVIIRAPFNADDNTLLNLAIEEMTRRTVLWEKRIIDKE